MVLKALNQKKRCNADQYILVSEIVKKDFEFLRLCKFVLVTFAVSEYNLIEIIHITLYEEF